MTFDNNLNATPRVRKDVIKALPKDVLTEEMIKSFYWPEDRKYYLLTKYIQDTKLLEVLDALANEDPVNIESLSIVAGAYHQLMLIHGFDDEFIDEIRDQDLNIDLTDQLVDLRADWSDEQGVGYKSGEEYGYDHVLEREDLVNSYTTIINAILTI